MRISDAQFSGSKIDMLAKLEFMELAHLCLNFGASLIAPLQPCWLHGLDVVSLAARRIAISAEGQEEQRTENE